MARMHGNGLQRSANVFKLGTRILRKSLKTYYGLLSLQKLTSYLLLGDPGALCVREKAFNHNFTKVVTKHE